jgi:hypothetical protein
MPVEVILRNNKRNFYTEVWGLEHYYPDFNNIMSELSKALRTNVTLK